MPINMINLYRQDRSYLNKDSRLYQTLDIPPRVATKMCTAYPRLWEYIMDFTQEGNLKLLQADKECDQEWDIEHFRTHVAAMCKGAILHYLARTHDIYIPPTSRHRMLKERGQEATIEWLEHHVRWDVLHEHMAQIPDTTMQQASNNAAKKKIDEMLLLLPEKERKAVELFYGVNGHAHTSQEIGTLLSVHTDRAKQIVNTALKRLKNEPVKQSREWINRDRQERLEALYKLYPDIGSTELSLLAKCHTTAAAAFLKSKAPARV